MLETYIAIYFLMFCFFLLIGKSGVKKHNYWLKVSPLILIFTLIEGLRYMRGIDYYHYALFYDFPLLSTFNQDVGFSLLNTSLRFLRINAVGAFIVYAFITIISLCTFMKRYPEIWKLGFLIMLIATLHESEWMIRQFISLSIMYAALGMFIERKYLFFILIACISVSIHYSSIFFFVAIVFLYFLDNPISLKVSIFLFVFFVLIIRSDMLLPFIDEIVSRFNISDDMTYSVYIDNADNFLSNKAKRQEMERSFFTNVLNYLFYLIIYVECYFILQKNRRKEYIIVYNLFIVGSILYECFLTYELYRRIIEPMYLLWFVLVSYLLSRPKQLKYNFSVCFLWFFILAYAIKYIFLPQDNYYLFIWDK